MQAFAYLYSPMFIFLHCATKFFFVNCVTFFGGFLFYQFVNVSWHPRSPHLLISSSKGFCGLAHLQELTPIPLPHEIKSNKQGEL